jgi:hypothetical protein
VPKKRAEHYGVTPKGKKYHAGVEVIPYVGTKKSYRVQTYCGAEMLSEDTDLDAGRRMEFCKNCFRRMAWDALMERLGGYEAAKETGNRRADRTAGRGAAPG